MMGAMAAMVVLVVVRLQTSTQPQYIRVVLVLQTRDTLAETRTMSGDTLAAVVVVRAVLAKLHIALSGVMVGWEYPHRLRASARNMVGGVLLVVLVVLVRPLLAMVEVLLVVRVVLVVLGQQVLAAVVAAALIPASSGIRAVPAVPAVPASSSCDISQHQLPISPQM
jgi:hypothetical protein